MPARRVAATLLIGVLALTGCSKEDRDEAARKACRRYADARGALLAGDQERARNAADDISREAAKSGRKDLIEAATRFAAAAANRNADRAEDARRAFEDACRDVR